LWIDEGFTSINPGTWQETNLFRGTQSINVNTHANRLSLDAAPGIEHAIYRLESIRQWPLESLRGLQVSFIQLPPSQHGGSAELSFRVGLANDPAYYFGCSALPAGTDGTLRCSIREPERVLELNRPGNYSLDEWHKLIIQFVPQSYSVRFFLDGEFFGQSAIPTVEVWRGRDFKASLQMEATGLETGPASFQVDELLLARQE
jgi:hypothetical protein